MLTPMWSARLPLKAGPRGSDFVAFHPGADRDVGMGLSGSLLIVQARRVVMTAQVIMMTVQMTTYEKKDNCEPDG
jgi:hypothetical protein